ncbi:MAG: antioxidant, AhpC/TSA family protein [Porphyromonadaceae bacterium]|nr:antioxidant, AhpC/TSA family protein [Porphyromonadaceae bacterium]
MTTSIKKLWGLTLALGVLLGGSCAKTQSKFVAEGIISGADGQVIYLEEVGTGDIFALDSVRLDARGAFRFEYPGRHYPMFYRLRLGDSSIPFAADSATYIQVKSDASSFFFGYELVEADQYNRQIREISLYRHQVDRQIDSILGLYTRGTLGLEEAQQEVERRADALKAQFTNRYIYVDPKSPSAYFALFQRKGNASYFSTQESEDARAFAAVATAYDTYYKDAPYAPFLKEMALKAIALERAQRQRSEALADTTARTALRMLDFPEIKLKDRFGDEQSLTEIAQRGPVLVSFTTYSAQWSPLLVASLRAAQERNPQLQIYEVSVDADRYYWENAVRTLPWICVSDPDGISLKSYNVSEVPTFFYIKNGELKRIAKPEEAL